MSSERAATSPDRGAVLVVDDDAHLARTVCDILELNGYEAVSAQTGEHGLEIAARSEEIPVALVDLRLPDMDGLELVARLRDVSALTQVVILTGNASLDTAVAALRENSCDYLIKPVAPEKLVATVRRGVQRWYHRSVEEDLRRDRERFQLLVEALSELITIVTPDGLIQWQSPSALQTLGHEQGALMETRFLDHVRPDEREAVARSLAAASSAPGDERAFEFHFRTATGEWRLMEGVARTLHARPEAPVVVTGRDITERRLLEEELRQSQKMESIGRLAGGVAHDFNNQLTAIISSVDLAGLQDDLSDSVAEELREIRMAAERAARLTRQLLIFSRKDVAAPRRVNMNDVVRDIESMLRRLVPASLELVTELRSDLPPVFIDLTQLEQIILNLVVNARDAMLPGGGRVVLRTLRPERDPWAPRTEEESAAPDGWVILEVEDDGLGMKREVLEQIFEPFFTTKGPGRGTGLGLATCYGIVTRAGGVIRARSKPGAGTTFQVLLPARPGEPERTVVGSEEADSGPDGTRVILVVEDDDGVRRVLGKMLERRGYEVITAANGPAALKNLPDGPLHLLVTDLVMPGMNGREVAEAVKARCPEAAVLFTSGYVDGEALGDGPLPFGGDLLTKPVDSETFFARVAAALERAG